MARCAGQCAPFLWSVACRSIAQIWLLSCRVLIEYLRSPGGLYPAASSSLFRRGAAIELLQLLLLMLMCTALIYVTHVIAALIKLLTVVDSTRTRRVQLPPVGAASSTGLFVVRNQSQTIINRRQHEPAPACLQLLQRERAISWGLATTPKKAA